MGKLALAQYRAQKAREREPAMMTQRDALIIARLKAGEGLQRIGRSLDLSRERIRQIGNKYGVRCAMRSRAA